MVDFIPIDSVSCKLLQNEIISVRVTFIDTQFIDTHIYMHGENNELISISIRIHSDMNKVCYTVPVEHFMSKVHTQSITYYVYGPVPSIFELYHDVSNTVYNITVQQHINFKEN